MWLKISQIFILQNQYLIGINSVGLYLYCRCIKSIAVNTGIDFLCFRYVAEVVAFFWSPQDGNIDSNSCKYCPPLTVITNIIIGLYAGHMITQVANHGLLGNVIKL